MRLILVCIDCICFQRGNRNIILSLFSNRNHFLSAKPLPYVNTRVKTSTLRKQPGQNPFLTNEFRRFFLCNMWRNVFQKKKTTSIVIYFQCQPLSSSFQSCNQHREELLTPSRLRLTQNDVTRINVHAVTSCSRQVISDIDQ